MAASVPPAPDDTGPDESRARRHWGVPLLWLMPVFVLGVVFAYGWLTREPPDTGAPRVGQPLADFALPDLGGRTVQLASLRGKVVFVNVWATWCQPCIEEMPTIQKLHERLQPRGLTVLAVSLDALGEQVVGPFMRTYQLTFPTLLDVKNVVQRLYRTTGVPESFIVDKQGILVEKVIGPRDWAHPQVLALFERLMAAAPPKPAGSGS